MEKKDCSHTPCRFAALRLGWVACRRLKAGIQGMKRGLVKALLNALEGCKKPRNEPN